MEPSPAAVASAVHASYVTGYVAAAALSCTVWDHALTMPDEVRYIWKGKKLGLTGALFLVNRYSTEAGLIFLVWYEQWNNVTSCRDYLITMSILVIFSIVVENAAIAIRVYTLWERSKTTMIVLWIGFVVTYAVVLTSFVLALRWLHENSLDMLLNACAVTKRPSIVAVVWGALLAFDLFMFAMFIANALSQPYRRGSDIFGRLKKDGLFVYGILSMLRLLNLILTISLQPNTVFVAPIIQWGLGSTVLSRLILKVEETKAKASVDGLDTVYLYELASPSPEGECK